MSNPMIQNGTISLRTAFLGLAACFHATMALSAPTVVLARDDRTLNHNRSGLNLQTSSPPGFGAPWTVTDTYAEGAFSQSAEQMSEIGLTDGFAVLETSSNFPFILGNPIWAVTDYDFTFSVTEAGFLDVWGTAGATGGGFASVRVSEDQFTGTAGTALFTLNTPGNPSMVSFSETFAVTPGTFYRIGSQVDTFAANVSPNVTSSTTHWRLRPIPEPSTALLSSLIGCWALMARRRRIRALPQ